MRKELQSMLGVKAYRSAPDTLEEFDACAKEKGAALAYADAEAYYRSIAPKVRNLFLDRVEKATGIAPRVTSESTDAEGKVTKTYEKDTSYIKAVKAAGTDEKLLTDILQKCYDEVGYDLSTTRNTGPNKADKEQADFIIAAIARGEGTYAGFARKIMALNPGLVLELNDEGELDHDDIAGAFKVNRLRLEAPSQFMGE